MTVYVYGKPVIITNATMQRTREHFAEIHNNCANEQLKTAIERKWSVASHVDIAAYVAKERESAAYSLAGHGDHTLTFVQRAVWIQTGQSVPLLT